MVRSIKELVEYILWGGDTSNPKSKLEHLKGKQKELYNIIVEQNIQDDINIFEALYVDGKKKTYSKLKDRLYQRLLEIAFGQTREGEKVQYRQIRERSIKQTAMLKILLFRGLPYNVVEMSKKLINVCVRYEFNDLLLDVLIINMELYGRSYQNETKFYRMQSLYNKTLALVQLENEIQIKYFRYFVDHATSSKLGHQETIAQLRSDEQFFLEQVSKKRSAKSTIFSYNALCIIYELFGEHISIVQYVTDALKYLRNKPQDSSGLRLSFLQKKFRAQLKLGEKVELLQTLQEIEGSTQRNSISFFQTSLYKMLMWCHDRQYVLVLSELNKVFLRKAKFDAPKTIQEYFNIVHGFIAFLTEAEVFQVDKKEIEKFRVFKFINEVPLFSKDKKGVNISILILHVLFMLQRRRHDDIIDRVESLQLYSYRYLRKDDTFRSNCFIKMIIQMTKANFHPIRTERYAAELFEKLKGVPLELSEQPLEVEIIPYEHLWEIVMQLLERNSKIKRGRPKSNS